VGKGAGTVFLFGRDSRAPCPPSVSTQAAPSLVGTAHDRCCSAAVPCHRLCPPYKARKWRTAPGQGAGRCN